MAKRKAARRAAPAKSSRKRSAARPARRTATKRTAKAQASARKKKAPAKKSASTARPKPIAKKKAAARAKPKAAAKAPVRREAKPGNSSAMPGKVPRLDRVRRTLDEGETRRTPPSSLDMDRRGSAARTGRAEAAQNVREHHGMDSVTGGDPDVDIEDAYFTGEEAPG